MVSELALQVAVGAVMWVLALAFPFRRMAPNSELRWDLCAVGFVIGFGVLASALLSWLYGPLEEPVTLWRAAIGAWPPATIAAGYVLFADFSSYAAHRLLHTGAFWHAHAFHHSSRHLYVLSGLRGSPVHVAALIAGPLLALVLFPIHQFPLLFLLITGAQVANQHYIHSNIRVPIPRCLELVFVTPRYHFVHHSLDRRLSNTNFGFLFSVWDRMFGTFTAPATVPETQPLGLEYANSRWRLLIGLPPAISRSRAE